MAKSHSDFVVYLLELLEPLGNVSAKRMFGGYGLYHDSLMIALVADDTLYFKADAQTQARFVALDLEPFVYHKNGKPYSMSYYQAPNDALEDGDELCDWARAASAAARRAAGTKRRSDKKKTPKA